MKNEVMLKRLKLMGVVLTPEQKAKLSGFKVSIPKLPRDISLKIREKVAEEGRCVVSYNKESKKYFVFGFSLYEHKRNSTHEVRKALKKIREDMRNGSENQVPNESANGNNNTV